MKAAKEAWREAKEAEQGLHRYGALMSQLPPSVGNAVGSVQQLVVRIESLQAEVLLAAAPRPAGAAPRRRTADELAALLAESRTGASAAPLAAPAPAGEAHPPGQVVQIHAKLRAPQCACAQLRQLLAL